MKESHSINIPNSESVTREVENILRNAELMVLLVDWIFSNRESMPPPNPSN